MPQKDDLTTAGWGLLHHESSKCTNLFIATHSNNTVFKWAKEIMLAKQQPRPWSFSGYLTSHCCCGAVCNTVDDIFETQARLALIDCPWVRWCTVTFGTVLATCLLKGKKMQITTDIMILLALYLWGRLSKMLPLTLFHSPISFLIFERASAHRWHLVLCLLKTIK